MAILLWTVLILVIALAALYVGGNLYVRWYFDWENRNRKGMAYYGLALKDRRRFRDRIRFWGQGMRPFVALEVMLRKAETPQKIPSLKYEGLHVPTYSCSRDSLELSRFYKPDKEDVFVVTQMKCGTTWMQQIVFEILNRGQGNLSDEGYGHLYAVSPWLESDDGVKVREAPLVGQPARRIIKTHLPAAFCPSSSEARYIYVARHPAGCAASVFDYFDLMMGPLAPSEQQLVDWYCSDGMWWQSWPDHVEGWWQRAKENKDVLFLFYETMKEDLSSVVDQVASFLNVTLTEPEKKSVLEKSSFDFMKENEEVFEMSPPNMFSVAGTYFKSGSAERHTHLSEAHCRQILDYCRTKMRDGAFLEEQSNYPDLAPDQGI